MKTIPKSWIPDPYDHKRNEGKLKWLAPVSAQLAEFLNKDFNPTGRVCSASRTVGGKRWEFDGSRWWRVHHTGPGLLRTICTSSLGVLDSVWGFRSVYHGCL